MRAWLVSVALSLAAGSCLQGEALEVCVRDSVGLNTPALTSFRQELETLLGEAEVRLRNGSCASPGIQLFIRLEAPQAYQTALGLAQRRSGQILPRLEVYLNPVLRMLNEVRAPAVVGRALARVAAHEIAHFLSQQSRHDSAGLLRERFLPHQLAAEDPQPFYLTRASR